MALTDNRTQLQDSDLVADVAAASTADPQSRTTETGLLIEGGSALQFQVTNAQEYLAYDRDLASATFSLDLSDQTVYICIKDNLNDTFANLGALVFLDDGADAAGGDAIGYAAGGSDVRGLVYRRAYSSFKLDVSVVVAVPGSFFTFNGLEANLDHTAILQVGYGSIHLAKAQGTTPNTWFDGIYHIANDSFAATVLGGTSGTPETMTDLVGDDEAVGACMFSNPVASQYFIFAPTEWGDSGVASTAFAGTDEQWYYLGDNGGGHAVGVTHFPMRLLGNATGTNIFRQTRVTNINTGTPAEFDWSDANFDEIALDTTTWVDFGAITCPDVDASKNCDDSTFINCAQMIVNAMNMDGNTWIGSTDAGGAVLWPTTPAGVQNQDNSTFISDGTGHAIEIALNTASLTTYNIDGYTFDGYAGQSGTAGNRVFLIDNLLDGDVTINITNGAAINIVGGGSGFSFEAAAGYTGTVTINTTVTLTVQCDDSDGNGIEGVAVRIENASTGALIAQGNTNASGTFTDATFNFTGDLNVLTKARLKGFFYDRQGGTIISTGLIVSFTLRDNPIVDLP